MNKFDRDKYPHPPELEAQVYYLTTQEGGRVTPVATGYRGQFYYDGNNYDAPQEFVDKETCSPGESVKAYFRTLSPHYHIGKFYEGKEFEIREGARVVGKGIITKVLREDFNIKDEE
ncbi:MAG: hypothetical protein E6772_02860 [Dysgonomonas sp.]|nr:hypothetical protein [Dysgonomonas sp.]